MTSLFSQRDDSSTDILEHSWQSNTAHASAQLIGEALVLWQEVFCAEMQSREAHLRQIDGEVEECHNQDGVHNELENQIVQLQERGGTAQEQ
jgi:hypothetical protein